MTPQNETREMRPDVLKFLEYMEEEKEEYEKALKRLSEVAYLTDEKAIEAILADNLGLGWPKDKAERFVYGLHFANFLVEENHAEWYLTLYK